MTVCHIATPVIQVRDHRRDVESQRSFQMLESRRSLLNDETSGYHPVHRNGRETRTLFGSRDRFEVDVSFD